MAKEKKENQTNDSAKKKTHRKSNTEQHEKAQVI